MEGAVWCSMVRQWRTCTRAHVCTCACVSILVSARHAARGTAVLHAFGGIATAKSLQFTHSLAGSVR